MFPHCSHKLKSGNIEMKIYSEERFKMMTNPTRAKKSNARKRRLPDNFTPAEYSVICGRGKGNSKTTGNCYLKSLISSYLKSYSEARQKNEKSAIVSDIMKAVKQEAAPEAAFVKHEGNVWYEVTDSFAREKIGCMFRDRLHEQYRSSNKAKLARKKAREVFKKVDERNEAFDLVDKKCTITHGNTLSDLHRDNDFVVSNPRTSKAMTDFAIWPPSNSCCQGQLNSLTRRPDFLRSSMSLPLPISTISSNDKSTLKEAINQFNLNGDDHSFDEHGDLPDDISGIFED